VSVVRLRKGGKRFELACYRNKILDLRRGLAPSLDDVLQIPHIFLNVSKGHMASKADLVKSFGTDDRDQIIAEILKKGEVQVGDKERAQQHDETWREVVRIITEKCVDPNTRRGYTATVIDRVLRDAGFNIHPTRSAKQQALEAIRVLQEKNVIPIARAQMRLRIVMSAKDAKRIKEKLMPLVAKVEDEDWGDEFDMVCLVDPGQFRPLTELVQGETKGRGRVETLNLSETLDKDEVMT